jgi:hypothetical protein
MTLETQYTPDNLSEYIRFGRYDQADWTIQLH